MKDWLLSMCTPQKIWSFLFRRSKLWWVMQNALYDKISLKKCQCLAEPIGDAQWIDYIHMMTLGPWVLLVWLKIIERVHMFHSEIPSSSRTIWSLLRPLAEVNWATSPRLTWRLRFFNVFLTAPVQMVIVGLVVVAQDLLGVFLVGQSCCLPNSPPWTEKLSCLDPTITRFFLWATSWWMKNYF